MTRPDWVLGFQDEVWWSRFARPSLKAWIGAHNRRARAEGGVRIVTCRLPSKSPWLNRIEPCWVHGKRAIHEPERPLTIAEVMERVCTYYGCEQLPPLERDVG